jgi:hypothetical protein
MLPTKSIAVFAAGCLVLGAAAAHAQDAHDTGPDADSLDVTMTLLPEGAKQPDAVTRTITLPSAASSQAASASASGLDKANANRARRENGLKTAEEARAEGRDFGQEMRQQAAEQRENAERGKRPSDAGPPGQPGAGNPPSLPDQANPPASTPPAPTPPSVTPPAHPKPSH